MGIYNIDKLLNPESIAVIGASERSANVGGLAVKNLAALNFKGGIYPVNPKHQRVFGQACIPDVLDLESGIDLAVISTAIHRVPAVLKSCAAKGIPTAMVVSDIRREPAESRENIANEISRIAYDSNIRLLGPGSMGFVNTAAKLNISYSPIIPKKGKLAFVSQSASLFTATLDMAFKEQIGFSYFISTGGMADIDFGDMVDFLGNDERVGSILLYIHTLKNPKKFLSAARSVSPLKPIVVMKSGHRQGAFTFTADNIETPAFEEAVYGAAFKRAGIVCVDNIDEMFDLAELMSKQPRPRGDHLVAIGNGGGTGSKTFDMMYNCDMPPDPLNSETIEALDQVLPPYWSRTNPINLLSGAGVDNYVHAVSTCLKDRSINGLLIAMVPEAGTDSSEVARALVDTLKGARIPVLAAWCGGASMDDGIDIFNAAGIPTFRTPEKAIKAFSHLIDYNRNQETAMETPAKLNRRLKFDQEQARTIMAGHASAGKIFYCRAEGPGHFKRLRYPGDSDVEGRQYRQRYGCGPGDRISCVGQGRI